MASILLRLKVLVTAAIRLGSCGRNTVTAVRPKTPFGRSLERMDIHIVRRITCDALIRIGDGDG